MFPFVNSNRILASPKHSRAKYPSKELGYTTEITGNDDFSRLWPPSSVQNGISRDVQLSEFLAFSVSDAQRKRDERPEHKKVHVAHERDRATKAPGAQFQEIENQLPEGILWWGGHSSCRVPVSFWYMKNNPAKMGRAAVNSAPSCS